MVLYVKGSVFDVVIPFMAFISSRQMDLYGEPLVGKVLALFLGLATASILSSLLSAYTEVWNWQRVNTFYSTKIPFSAGLEETAMDNLA